MGGRTRSAEWLAMPSGAASRSSGAGEHSAPIPRTRAPGSGGSPFSTTTADSAGAAAVCRRWFPPPAARPSYRTCGSNQSPVRGLVLVRELRVRAQLAGFRHGVGTQHDVEIVGIRCRLHHGGRVFQTRGGRQSRPSRWREATRTTRSNSAWPTRLCAAVASPASSPFSCRIVVARPLVPPCVAPRDPGGPSGAGPLLSRLPEGTPSGNAGRHLEELRATRVARTSRNDAARGKERLP